MKKTSKKIINKKTSKNKTKKNNTYVVDTSAVIEKVVSGYIKSKKIKQGKIIIPHAVIAELENQANKRLEIGFIGLEEIQEIRSFSKKNKKIILDFAGDRPTETQIKFAKSGEIDAYIRNLAHKNDATLITADKVQAESAKALGVCVDHIEIKKYNEPLSIEKYFDKHTMSLHLKEKCPPLAKKGKPGSWELVKIKKSILKNEYLQEIAKEVVEKARLDSESFIEISRRGSTIVQYKDMRIVIVKPPVSDGWEITIVRPITKKNLEDYKLPEDLMQRIKKEAQGVLITGETGSGKSCFIQALGEYYKTQDNIVKTVESPRDLQLSDEITQYSKSFTSSEEIHDILFLSRPDKILFDEVRDNPDFQLYVDLRLAGSVVGVVHAIGPIDAIQRFIPRIETGMLPSIIDTVIFVEEGKIKKVFTLNMTVKVPAGMTESDLARPVIEITDFNTKKAEYEIYSYGEETVIIPLSQTQQQKSGVLKLAEKEIEKFFKQHVNEAKAELISNNRAIVQIPEKKIGKIIGSSGKNIEKIEKQLGISIEIKELKKERKSINFEVEEDKKYIRLYTKPGQNTEIYIDNNFLLSVITSRNGEIRIHKKSVHGRELVNALNKNKRVELRA